MITILIFGKNGMLGKYLTSYLSGQTYRNLYEVIGFNRQDFNVETNAFTDLCSLLDRYQDRKTVIIINAIGLILPNKCLNHDRNLLINSLFPNMLSIICRYFNWKLIQPSTDCVFNGNIKGVNMNQYVESDVPDETNIYGRSKHYGELMYGTTIRVSIIGEEINHKYSLIEWVKSNRDKQISGYVNHYWNGITCLQYAKIIDQIIQKNLFWNGVRHLYSPRIVTKYELLELINKHYHLNSTINPIQTTCSNDKTLNSLYPDLNQELNIPDLDQQIRELSMYKLQI